jgi:ATP-dependent helicase YprA (DUF1998 family)
VIVSGVRCGAYHAGLRPAERERVLGDWTGGRLPAVAATVAFGMGIDRGGVALVAHYNLPKSLEGFYQVRDQLLLSRRQGNAGPLGPDMWQQRLGFRKHCCRRW